MKLKEINEVTMIEMACKKLEQRFGRDNMHLGVPCLNRCIDLLVEAEEGLIAFEFKLDNWRRAIIQSKDHLLGVDFAIVCIPIKKNVSPILEEIDGLHVGLWLYDIDSEDDWPFQEIQPPKPSNCKWKVAERWIYERIDRGDFLVGDGI